MRFWKLLRCVPGIQVIERTMSDLRCSVVYDSLQPHSLEPPRLPYPKNSMEFSKAKKTEVVCHFLLQRIP